jgi:hypothetical protein
VSSDNLGHQRIAVMKALHDRGVELQSLKFAPFPASRIAGRLNVRSDRFHANACVIYNWL